VFLYHQYPYRKEENSTVLSNAERGSLSKISRYFDLGYTPSYASPVRLNRASSQQSMLLLRRRHYSLSEISAEQLSQRHLPASAEAYNFLFNLGFRNQVGNLNINYSSELPSYEQNTDHDIAYAVDKTPPGYSLRRHIEAASAKEHSSFAPPTKPKAHKRSCQDKHPAYYH
jgi:hypothetical protein